MLAPPRPGSVTSLDCPDEEMSLHFGSLSLFLGPVAPASQPDALACPCLLPSGVPDSYGSSVICLGVL